MTNKLFTNEVKNEVSLIAQFYSLAGIYHRCVLKNEKSRT